jgi:hypothetical protein
VTQKSFCNGWRAVATEKQIAANRANAKRSTGPKTKRGRQASSRNALRHGLSCPLPMDESASIDVDNLMRMLVHEGVNDDQFAAARQVVQAELDLSRVRMARATLIGSLDLERYNFGQLRYLMIIDRYERIARAKRRMAAIKL